MLQLQNSHIKNLSLAKVIAANNFWFPSHATCNAITLLRGMREDNKITRDRFVVARLY